MRPLRQPHGGRGLGTECALCGRIVIMCRSRGRGASPPLNKRGDWMKEAGLRLHPEDRRDRQRQRHPGRLISWGCHFERGLKGPVKIETLMNWGTGGANRTHRGWMGGSEAIGLLMCLARCEVGRDTSKHATASQRVPLDGSRDEGPRSGAMACGKGRPKGKGEAHPVGHTNGLPLGLLDLEASRTQQNMSGRGQSYDTNPH